MRCLVLGGGGFLGSHLCDALLSEGYSVRIFDRPNLHRFREFSGNEDVEWIEGDFANDEDIGRAVLGCDVIYHFISTTLPKSSNDNPVYDVETNIVGTLNLLSHSIQGSVRKIIFLSSGGTVYGVPQVIPIKEDHPTDPICSYGIGKLAIEKYFHLYRTLHDLDYCVLRLANPFGERQRVVATQGAIAVFLDKALKGEQIEIWGDGSVVRDYIYISDVVNAMVRAIEYQGDGRVLNIGSGKGQSINEILNEIEKLIGCDLRRNYTPGRALDVPSNVLDIEKSIYCLNWKPEVSFREGLERTMSWMRVNRCN